MATSSFDSVFRIGCTTFAIPVGLTNNAKYFGVEAYKMCSHIQYVSGGTLVVLGVNYGETLAAATLAVTGYHYIDGNDSMEIRGPACYYIGALGATTVATIQTCYSQGASFLP